MRRSRARHVCRKKHEGSEIAGSGLTFLPRQVRREGDRGQRLRISTVEGASGERVSARGKESEQSIAYLLSPNVVNINPSRTAVPRLASGGGDEYGYVVQ
jgi:hypothetical protein